MAEVATSMLNYADKRRKGVSSRAYRVKPLPPMVLHLRHHRLYGLTYRRRTRRTPIWILATLIYLYN